MTTQHKCCNINHSTGWPLRCTKPAKVERDGKHYCGLHDPLRIAEKNRERNAAWQTKWDAEQAEYTVMKQKALEQKRRADCYDDLLETLIQAQQVLQLANETPNGPISDTIWMTHGPETLFDFLDAAIAKATGAA